MAPRSALNKGARADALGRDDEEMPFEVLTREHRLKELNLRGRGLGVQAGQNDRTWHGPPVSKRQLSKVRVQRQQNPHLSDREIRDHAVALARGVLCDPQDVVALGTKVPNDCARDPFVGQQPQLARGTDGLVAAISAA